MNEQSVCMHVYGPHVFPVTEEDRGEHQFPRHGVIAVAETPRGLREQKCVSSARAVGAEIPSYFCIYLYLIIIPLMKVMCLVEIMKCSNIRDTWDI